jgi:hypothetical protein
MPGVRARVNPVGYLYLDGSGIFTPAGWLNARSQNAKKAFLPFQPGPEDTLRVLRVNSKGCASGTSAGPVCDTITHRDAAREGVLSPMHSAVFLSPLPWHLQTRALSFSLL